ncbi:DUF883 C-terminal domain-containing protein [Desulfococcus multivorans]|uniref:DUF883 domain-containing protein n=1 Tax=Desulfococcus multivorans DSM 2059 TaxID=1121405 RepID=S7T7P4_DESML|nr:DUF883 C-terminal domain-containing protein [Desulfococcus multivorans]AOY56965.1 uncharacterized protein Dmul_01890 [Desulfococcus multivorans]AQU99485.1 hypothetical protein B2D07_00955 [Desulfococcus multivorans]EPR32535.1 hypothetical protein dsmv_3617 [Desulfococcus multivorans DSM 2059]SKA29334.1 hypothetical protein SAMN02745446_03839 [Desulfococcus multivorans DSM 2059]
MEKNNTEVDDTEETAASFQGSGKSTGFGNVKTVIADKLHKAAEAIGEKAADPDAQSGMAPYGNQISGWLDQSAEYVRQFDYEQADARVREYVRQKPGRSLLIAGGIGLMIGAMLRRR